VTPGGPPDGAEPLHRTWAARSTERSGTPRTGGPTMARSATVPAAPQAATPTWAVERRGRGERAVVPPARPVSYYGRPILKPPPWEPLIPAYFFFGGLAGASAALAAGARLAGEAELERRAWAISLAGLAISPPLLIADLGRPERFINMFRVFKVTSPMSVGSWLLAGAGGVATAAAASAWTGRLPAAGTAAAIAAGVLGPLVASYTGGLLADTAVPAWHEARRELPFVFAGSAMASAGAAAVVATPAPHARQARRLLATGALVEIAAERLMERRLGDVAEPYRRGASGRLARAAVLATAAGSLLAVPGGASRGRAVAGGLLTLAGSACERLAVFEAGKASARDPKYVVAPQRRRLEAARPSS
jgi:hypothetical protein